jgi:hypothetical protein
MTKTIGYVVTYDSYGDGVNDDWGSVPQKTYQEAIAASSVRIGALNARVEQVLAPEGPNVVSRTMLTTVDNECHYCGVSPCVRYPDGQTCTNCGAN